jgi:DNA modification methylase
MSKSKKYYYDADAISEEAITNNSGGCVGGKKYSEVGFNPQSGNEYKSNGIKNKRSVWTINIAPCKEAHFATFPKKLIEPMILAGCPKDGVVLDPFIGSGTTGMVAVSLQRKYVGIELNKKYCEEIASKRTTGVQQQIFV